MDLQKFQRLHFIGIGGMGMRALAEILIEKGMKISGSDVHNSDYLQFMKKQGADIFIGHEASHVDGADGIVISSAIHSDNPELSAARKKGIPVYHRSDVLAAMFQWGKGIAVAGAHGKSTTSAMIGKIFRAAGVDPTIVLGGAVDYLHGNSCLGSGEYVIAEADESDGSFLKFKSSVAVVTNIEDDHLDHYGTVENIKKAFVEFISHISDPTGAAIVCIDSQGVREVLPDLNRKVLTYGMSEEAEYRAVNKHYDKNHMIFDVQHKGKLLGSLKLQIPGTHNVRDALAAAVTGLYCGIPFRSIAKSLSEFIGVKRRFETKAYINDIWILDDYAHHPTEIEATLRAAKEIGGHRVICAFQPHRYSRTQLLQDEFASAFDSADKLYFTDIYAAGENPIAGVDGHLLPEKVRQHAPGKEVQYIDNLNGLAEQLYQEARPGDMIFTMGAGTIYQAGEQLIRLIQDKGLANDNKE